MSEEVSESSNLLGRSSELSAMAEVSNPYLSQIERGLSEPSAGVLKVNRPGTQPLGRSTVRAGWL